MVCMVAGMAHAQPVRRGYYHGDWMSFVPTRHVTGLAKSFDLVWIGTPYGVARFKPDARRWLPPLTVSSGLDEPAIRQIAFDENYQELWVETPMGVYSYNETEDEWRREPEFPVGLVKDDRGTVRFDQLFTPFEINYYGPSRDASAGEFVDRELRHFPISAALNDDFDRSRVFVGTWGTGLATIHRSTQSVEFHPSGLYQESVQAMLKDGPWWYFAGRDPNGDPPVISIFDVSDSSWHYEQPFYSVNAKGDVTCMAKLDRFVFYGTPTGLLKQDTENGRWQKYTGFDGLPDPGITALCPDGPLLWVGTPKGPGLLIPHQDTGKMAYSVVTAAIGMTRVYSLAKWQDHIWAGTEAGLFRIHDTSSDWSRIVTSTGLLKAEVRDLAVTPEGLWCATDLGLILLDTTLEAARIFRRDVELSPGNLFAVAADSFNVWAASSAGVWRYNKAKDTFRLYTRDDGLLHEFVYDIVLDGPHVWFATEGGVTRFLWNSPMRLD